MELAFFLGTLADLPAAMAGFGEIAIGPEPWMLLPLGPLQVFLGSGEPLWTCRLRVLDGPWFAWIDLPPPTLGIGRAPAYVLVALVHWPSDPLLSWELPAGPELSLYGTFGEENTAGLRVRLDPIWLACLVRQGGLSLWCGFSF